jgi:hypothetical protein
MRIGGTTQEAEKRMAQERVRKGGSRQEQAAEMDAVCERCGTVNPEETLLCKNCGNNLRDQRARRMSTAQVYDNLEPARPKTRWLTGLLTLFGLLLIVWTAMNASNIEDWLAAAQTTTDANGQEYFEGLEARPFEALNATLSQNPITQEQLNLAKSQPANPKTFEGRYAILRSGLGGDELFGEAQVAKQGDELIFTARLDNGMELRGTAHVEEDGRALAPHVAASYRGEYATGGGVAQPLQGLGYSLVGMLGGGNASYQATAYAIPSTGK